ncbi:MAG: hypothetical protein AB8B56_03140 [Crocinitomicaceae bacterium]
MKAYITLFTLTLTSLCFSQSNDKSNEFKLSNLSVGLTATRVLDKLHYPLSYELNASGGKTMGTITDQSSSSFYQLNAQYQLTQRFYVYSALGAGVDRQDSYFPLYSPTAVV